MRLDNYPHPMKEDKLKRLVGAVNEIDCGLCQLKYTPDASDISLNGSLYYKNCKQCRQHRLEMKKKSMSKKLTKSIIHNPL